MPVITWCGKSTFEYEGCIQTGTKIIFGSGNEKNISAAEWDKLREQFIGKVVKIGTSRDNPPPGSMGKWFYYNIHNQALLSYVGAILIREHYAVRESDTEIRVVR